MSFLNRIPIFIYVFLIISILLGVHFYKINQIKKRNELLHKSVILFLEKYENNQKVLNDIIKIREMYRKNIRYINNDIVENNKSNPNDIIKIYDENNII